jgi:hypothetical protein
MVAEHEWSISGTFHEWVLRLDRGMRLQCRSMDHDGRAVFAPARPAQHNLYRQDNPIAGLRQLATRDAIEQEICRNPAHLLSRLAHHCE